MGSPVLAWGPGRPTTLLKLGSKMAVAGVAPGAVALGTLASGATTPAASGLAVRLESVGGVRGVARTGDTTLFAAGDGSLYMSATDRDGEFTNLQFIDTRGAMITGLGVTTDGGVLATSVMPAPQNTHSGTVYQLSPAR